MPNWVSNTLRIIAESEGEYNDIVNTLATPIISKNSEDEFVDEPTEFSFQNILFVSRDKYEEYFTTNGYSPEKGKTGDTHYNWYNWNVMYWGCKWDACDVEVEKDPRDFSVIYRFNTPWSPPTHVMVALSEQFPNAIVNLEYEEEQGWGGEMCFQHGSCVQDDRYDIPNSHQEHMDRNQECPCEWAVSDDGSGYYADCPAPVSAAAGADQQDDSDVYTIKIEKENV
jgi:hypothetical protein